MHPTLFHVGNTDVSAYVVLHWLGIVAALAIGAVLAGRRGLPVARVTVALAIAGLGSFVGARLFSAGLNPTTAVTNPQAFLGWQLGAFHLEGALVVGVLVGIAVGRHLGLALGDLADVAAIAMAVRIALLRLGCFLAGCCFGVETDLPWGVSFPVGGHAWAHEVTSDGTVRIGELLGTAPPPVLHPTQLYELLAALSAAAIAWWLHRRGAPAGVAGVTATAAFLAFRALDWQLRAQTYEAPNWSLGLLSMACAGVCVLVLWRERHHRASAWHPETVT